MVTLLPLLATLVFLGVVIAAPQQPDKRVPCSPTSSCPEGAQCCSPTTCCSLQTYCCANGVLCCDPIDKKKRTRISGYSFSKDFFDEFCKSTPIHGLKYLAERNRPYYVRIGWIAILTVCLCIAVKYSIDLWWRLREKPTEFMTQTGTKYDDIANIPFPAITLCDSMKSPEGMTDDAMSFLCGQEFYNGDAPVDLTIFTKMQSSFNSTCTIELQYMQYTPNYESYCEKMFTKIITQHGVCFTFNMLNASEIYKEGINHYYSAHQRKSDWDPEKGYIEDAPMVSENGSSDPLNSGPFPKRAIGMQASFIIKPGLKRDGGFCTDDKPGIKYEGKEEPEGLFVELENGGEYFINVDAEVKSTHKELKVFPVEQRHCYFQGEKELNFFKHYTQLNCENECLISYTEGLCDCVDFYMPHKNGTKICSDGSQLQCMLEAQENFRKRRRACKCYPPCEFLKYDADFYYRRPSLGDPVFNESRLLLGVGISTAEYVITERKKAETSYYLVDFLANCGGVFGLFLGMSIISIIELGYYGTFKVINYYKGKSRTKKVSDNSVETNE